jgi:hypothetical protein
MSYAYANAAPRTTPVYANARTAVLRIARLFIAMLLNVSMSRCISMRVLLDNHAPCAMRPIASTVFITHRSDLFDSRLNFRAGNAICHRRGHRATRQKSACASQERN